MPMATQAQDAKSTDVWIKQELNDGEVAQEQVGQFKICHLKHYPKLTCFSFEFKSIKALHVDSLGQPKVTAGRDNCFRTCCPSVRRSVRMSPLFTSRKTKQQKTMFATGVTMGLAEWIIDDTCLVNDYIQK